MKKSRILLVAVALLTMLGLVSCEKDEDKILGTWEVTSCVITEGEGEMKMDGTLWEFKDDNTVTVNDDGNVQKGTYVFGKNALDITINVVDEITATVKMNGDVTEITDSKMTFEGSFILYIAGMQTDKCKIKATFKKK